MFTAFYHKNHIYCGDCELGGRITEKNGFYVEETLYDKMNGPYFLRIKYGTRTPVWKVWGEKNRNWGITFKPLSKGEAQEWVRKYLVPEAYRDIFGETENIA